MGFGLTEEQVMLQKNVRAFLEKEIAPLVDEYEQKSSSIYKQYYYRHFKGI